jgi:cardiolipin synthase
MGTRDCALRRIKATMPPFGWFEVLTGLYVLWVIGACLTLLMNRRSPTATLSWVFAFVALPFVSGVYYLVFGPRRLHRRRVRYKIARGLLGDDVSAYLRASCGQEAPRLSPDAAALAAVGERLGQGVPTFATRVDLIEDGAHYFDALEKAIDAAQHHIHLEYYIWEPDEVGERARDLLVKALERNLRVRVLYDAVGSQASGDRFWAPLRDAGAEVRAFNPIRFSLASINFANFRTHRKIAVFDGATALLGGMNLHVFAREWRDAHVLLEGEPVRRIQRLFLENWIYAGGNFMLTAENLARYFPPFNMDARVQGNLRLPVQVLASGPDDERAPIHAFFLAAISTARKRIWIETPYLIPDEPLEMAMKIAVLRGVDVQVIVPSRGDSRLVTAASHTYCEALGTAGVKVHEFGPAMLHAKTMVVDSTVAVVGTANLDNRSFRLNFEVATALYDPGSIERLAARIERDRAASVAFPERRRGPRYTALLESIARLTSPVL